MQVAQTPEPQLVGRGPELEALAQALERGRRGSAVIALRGAAGMGKSTLLAVLAERARTAGFAVAEGRAAEFERNLPFALAVDALDDALGGARLDALGDERLADLGAVLPSLGAGPAAGEGAPLERARYHRAIRAALEQLAPGRPLLISVDDVHWADAASVELLLHLLRRPPRTPHLLAIGLRPGGVADRVAAALRDLPQATRVELGPLDDEAAGSLLAGVGDAGRRAAILADSGGNPFFLRELAAAAAPRPAAADGDDGELPAAVAAAVAVEVERLPEPARALARGAAVAGEPFELEIAAAAAGLDPAAAAAALDVLRAADLVVDAGSIREFAFRHPVVRHAIYVQAPPGWRLDAHRRAGGALADRGAPTALRAHHAEVVASIGDAGAVALLTQAGNEALGRDPRSAERWFRAALRIVPEGAERTSLLERLARACSGSGRFDAAHDALEQALAGLEPGDGEAAVRLHLALAGVEHLLGRPNAAHDRLRAVLAMVPEGAVAVRAALEVELAINAQHRIDTEARIALTERARTTARALGDDVLLASVSGLHAISCLYAGDAEAARATCREAAGSLAQVPDERVAERIDALYHVALAATVLDDFPTAEGLVDRAVRIGRATGQDHLLVPMLVFRSMALHQWGRIDEAVAVAEEAEDAARLAGAAHPLHWALWMRANTADVAGDLETAIRAGEESVALAAGLDRATVTTLGRCSLAAIRLSAGDPEACRREMVAAAGESFDVGEPAWSCHLLASLVRACVALGDLDAADHWATRAEEIAASLGDPPIPAGRALGARGEVLLARGDAAATAQLALRAAEAAAALGARLNVWQAHLLAARALAAAGRRDDAVALLRGVADEAAAGGAGLFLRMAVRELRALGERVGASGRRAPPGARGLAALSDREREIAGLVAEGRTNREIAAALFLSEKTIERHLSRTFEKLGLRSRVELAGLVREASAGDAALS